MTTLSTPVPSHMEEFIKKQIKEGKAANKADVVRRALKMLEEEEAVQAILKAHREPTLRGDLRDLSKKIK
ncbi:MAG: type II toxin-antitoxin system ParD family antitoxin [bacterium]|nr:type II toxin-antitoxin system ParD family antitoxin [bacterium]